MDFTSHIKLVRRAAEFAQQTGKDDDGSGSGTADYSAVAMMLITATFIVYCLTLFKVRYMIGSVIGTLAIVEEPGSKIFVEIESFDEEGLEKKDSDLLLEPEVAVVKVKPVTAKLSTARAHVKANFGRAGGFRGLGLFAISSTLKTFLILPLSSVLTGHSAVLGIIAADVAVAKLDMVWIHHIIAAPEGTSSWFLRKDSFAVPWIKIAPAALLRSATFQLALSLPSLMYCAYSPMNKLAQGAVENPSPSYVEQGALLLAGSVVACLALIVLLYVPAYVTFVRVAASLLPQQNRTIVSFDRSFGGRIASGDKISLMAAWTSFNWEQRRRFMALWFKVFALMTTVTVLFAGIGAAELYLLNGLPNLTAIAGKF